jgi:hypothetical protein
MESSRWTMDFLEAKRSVGEPLADAVVAELFEQGQVNAVNRLLRDLVLNEEIVPESVPRVVRDYLEQTAQLPVWADPAIIARGEDVYCEYGPVIVNVHFTASLPECYACGNGAEVLYRTHKLTTDVSRRIVETAQFVMDVMAPGGLAPGGFGVRSAQKVRLMHAAVRYLTARDPAWKHTDWGVPINQEDQAGTLMTFATVALDGLKKLNITLSPEEEDAYVHSWGVVGYVLGIQEDLLPANAEDGRQLMSAIRRHQHRPTEAGRELTAALLSFMRNTMPGNAFDGVPASLLWYLCGDEIAQILGVGEPDWTRLLIGPLRFIHGLTEHVEHRSALLEKLAQAMHLRLLEGLIFVERGGNRVPFRIPETLSKQWGLSEVAQQMAAAGQRAS